MTDLDRRQLFGAAAAATAAAALSSFPASTAGAAVPPSGTQAPGFYRYKVGSFAGGFNRSSQHFVSG